MEKSTTDTKFWVSFYMTQKRASQSQWPRSLRCGSAATHLLGPQVEILPEAWILLVSVVCCQVEVSGMDWSLVQRSPRERECESECTCARMWSSV